MKITDVQVFYIRQTQVKEQCDSGQDALIVKVLTDSGTYGIGEVDSSPLAVKGAIESPFSHTTACGLRDLVIGEDPFETEKIWHKMYRGNIYGGRRGVGIHAMSGIDIALWDIKGKVLGLPIWKLLGRRISQEDSLLRKCVVRGHTCRDGGPGVTPEGPRLHGREVWLGSHGPGCRHRCCSG